MKYVWHKSDKYSSLDPITQVYGVCFDSLGRVLIIKEPGKSWNIPGGAPEAGETPIQTLKRELEEEVDVTIGANKMIGYYEVISAEPTVYQLRFVALLDELKTQTKDPATGVINERKFIEPSEFFEYIKYEDYRPMLDVAVEWLKFTREPVPS